jgi:GTPase SAR1 family protein
MVDQEENLESNSISMVRHKIVFVGDVAVGKTSIIYRFIENRFLENYEVIDYFNQNSRLLEWTSARDL